MKKSRTESSRSDKTQRGPKKKDKEERNINTVERHNIHHYETFHKETKMTIKQTKQPQCGTQQPQRHKTPTK